MVINEKVIIIPPYISTTWKNIVSLTVEERKQKPVLIVIIKSGKQIEIPELDADNIKLIFEYHRRFLEQEETVTAKTNPLGFGFSIPLSEESGNIETIGNAMQHNPNHSSIPKLPDELIQKIANIAKMMGLDEPENLPKPEANCNCIHCQVARALNPNSLEDQNGGEAVSDEDLKFRTWDIEQKDKHLYVVSNPLEKKEEYNVFLGNPIGCTCGKDNCEHIKAVLQS